MSHKTLLALGRHVGKDHGTATALELLRQGHSTQEAAAATGLPRAAVAGIESFYDLLGASEGKLCDGTACRFTHGSAPARERAEGSGVHCLGRCYAPPARTGPEGGDGAQIPSRCLAADPIVLRNVGPHASSLDLEEYGPELDPHSILDLLDQTELRGRGGAAYPTGAKWRAARRAVGATKFVVANGDEGDPGSYIDRLLLEQNPHSVLAGMKACATAIGANRGIVFIRGEYPRAARRMEAAISAAQEPGGPLESLPIEVRRGAGSYVCGEETALLRAIEGLRAEPSPRPPYPTSQGLWGLPTVVQNIETLSMIPWVLKHRRNPGRKAICVSGAVAQPGVIEIDLGSSLQDVLERGAGGPAPGANWHMALVGGPMGRVVKASDFATTHLDFDQLPGMGHGGTVVFDDSVSAGALAEHLFAFARSESCGSCTPCRVGTAQLHRCRTLSQLEDLLEVLEAGSLCGFGKGVPRPIRDLIEIHGGKVLQS